MPVWVARCPRHAACISCARGVTVARARLSWGPRQTSHSEMAWGCRVLDKLQETHLRRDLLLRHGEGDTSENELMCQSSQGALRMHVGARGLLVNKCEGGHSQANYVAV